MNLKNKTILITGAASGIGKIMALKCAERGCKRLILLDLNQEGLDEFSKELSVHPAEVFCYKVDLSQKESLVAVANEIKNTLGTPEVLINNAGVVFKGLFLENTPDQMEKTIDINSLAPMLLTSVFLKDMMKLESAYVCNISSSASLVSNPGMAIYASSKWALTGWSDSLYLEMKALKSKVGVLTIMPFFISTGMFKGVKSPILPILTPEKVAEKIIRGIENNRRMLAFPLSYRMIRITQALLPTPIYDFVMRDVFKIYHSMDEFEGRG